CVRLPSALLGVINILLLFFLARRLTLNTYTALLASFFLAISPWHIQFSRVNWETNFVLFFFFLANIFFLKAVEVPKWNKLLIPLSYLLFGLTVFTYNAAKVFTPIYVVLLTLIYFKYITKYKVLLLIGSIIFSVILGLNLLNPKISGTIRFQQVNFPNEWIVTTNVYKLTSNRFLSRIELIIKQYTSHFSLQFLFVSGDQNPRHSSQYTGQIYLFDGLFIILGMYFLLNRKNRKNLILLLWFFLAPVPASIVKEAPHASRAMFALGNWQIISAIGFFYLFSKVNGRFFFKSFLLFTSILVGIVFGRYFYLYLNDYPVKNSQDWQYGYKKIFTDFRNAFPKYDHVMISDQYGQPYIFALFYLKYDPSKFRAEVIRNNIDEWGSSAVKSFGKFTFGKVKPGNLAKGHSLIFASPTEKLAKIPMKGVIFNLDNSIAFYVYEYTN
ncbi:MAG: glycosyltransferase family 39 protein, partial [Actinobacteria bacterium]|nr:glycosyltransferase family 39 protein [Actinomycetota bacterium]